MNQETIMLELASNDTSLPSSTTDSDSERAHTQRRPALVDPGWPEKLKAIRDKTHTRLTNGFVGTLAACSVLRWVMGNGVHVQIMEQCQNDSLVGAFRQWLVSAFGTTPVAVEMPVVEAAWWETLSAPLAGVGGFVYDAAAKATEYYANAVLSIFWTEAVRDSYIQAMKNGWDADFVRIIEQCQDHQSVEAFRHCVARAFDTATVAPVVEPSWWEALYTPLTGVGGLIYDAAAKASEYSANAVFSMFMTETGNHVSIEAIEMASVAPCYGWHVVSYMLMTMVAVLIFGMTRHLSQAARMAVLAMLALFVADVSVISLLVSLLVFGFLMIQASCMYRMALCKYQNSSPTEQGFAVILGEFEDVASFGCLGVCALVIGCTAIEVFAKQ